MAKTYTAVELAIQAKSGGGTDIDDVAHLVDVYMPDLSDAAFDAMVDEVAALIPTVRFDPRIAAEWSRASSDFRAEQLSEARAFSCDF